jgi:inosose dehydratase
MTIQLAIAPIGWSNDDLPELGGHISFEQCIQEMSAANYTGCEVGHKFPRDTAVLTAALKPLNLRVASAWISTYFTDPARVEQTIIDFKQHMHFLKSMQANVIVVCECGGCIQGLPQPVLKQQPQFNAEQWRDLIKGLHHIGRLAKEQGMTIVYHHHMGTGIQSLQDIDKLMQQTDSDLVSLLLDTGHLHFAGEDALKVLKKHYSRIKHVHFKDIRAAELERVKHDNLSFLDAVKAGVFTVPGDGCIDFAPIVNFLRAQQYDGWVVVEAEQDPVKAPPFDYARKARNYLQSLFGF